MKALVISKRNDFRLISLISPLQKMMEVGFMKDFDRSSYDQFKADLVFSDDPENTPEAYDLNGLSKLKPFVNLDSYRNSKPSAIYEADVSYIGPITDMNSSLLSVFKLGYNVRNFFATPSMLGCYSGSIDMNECWGIYGQAKVSPIPKGDLGYRELDIILAEGNPLKECDDFVNEIVKGVKGKKFPKSMGKTAILSGHTNYDRVAAIVEKLGYGVVSKKILSLKEQA